jgi:hypothetical protein
MAAGAGIAEGCKPLFTRLMRNAACTRRLESCALLVEGRVTYHALGCVGGIVVEELPDDA